jgi:sortase A
VVFFSVVALTLVRGVGQLLVTIGVLIMLFIGYELWGTSIATHAAQHRLAEQLQRQWQSAGGGGTRAVAAPLHLRNGQPFAVLTVPRLGDHYREVLVEGVDTEDLREGAGHYPGSALPGQVGNFAVAGHRTTYGAPFGNIDRLRPRDTIDVHVAHVVYEYSVTGSEIVRPENVGVVAPVPDHPGQSPTQRMLTLTTCNPKYSAQQRLIVHAVLERVINAGSLSSGL